MYEQHRFALQLAHLTRAWRAEMDRRLADSGLSQARWLVLLHLMRSDSPPTQRELAESIGIESPTLARTLDALEHKQLIRRQPCTSDRRVNKVLLTDQASDVVNSIEVIAGELRAQVFDGIDAEEIIQCQRLHQRMLKNLEMPHET